MYFVASPPGGEGRTILPALNLLWFRWKLPQHERCIINIFHAKCFTMLWNETELMCCKDAVDENWRHFNHRLPCHDGYSHNFEWWTERSSRECVVLKSFQTAPIFLSLSHTCTHWRTLLHTPSSRQWCTRYVMVIRITTSFCQQRDKKERKPFGGQKIVNEI